MNENLQCSLIRRKVSQENLKTLPLQISPQKKVHKSQFAVKISQLYGNSKSYGNPLKNFLLLPTLTLILKHSSSIKLFTTIARENFKQKNARKSTKKKMNPK